MMLLLKLSTMVVSVALAAGILARDHALVANRLIAAFLFCNAWWAGCEFFLYQATEPGTAVELLRWSTIGWLPLGVLCMHASLTLSSMVDHPIGRSTPYFYAAAALLIPLAIGTDWFISAAERGGLAWRPIFGPAFVLAYALMAVPVVSILFCWRRVMTLPGRGGQNELASIVFFGLSGALAISTVTSVILPILGFDAIGVTTSVIALVGVAAAWTLRRYGHSLISPEAFAREIFETLEDGIIVLGQGGLVRDANRAFRRMAGIDHAAPIGGPITKWLPAFPTQYSQLDDSTVMEVRSRAGKTLPVVVSAPVRLSGRGSPVGHAFLLRDRRELISLQRQLAVSGRHAMVGDLSKSISESIHAPATQTRRQLESLAADWREMLDWLQQKENLAPTHGAVVEGLELLGGCIEGVERINAIVQEVEGFSADSGQVGFARHALADIVESALRMTRSQAKPNVEIDVLLDAEVEVMGDRAELERLVTNLVVNSLQALGEDDSRATHLAVAVGAQGDCALLHVEDDGCGIPALILERIFDPFFTTKPIGEGTGLGLAISYHIVRKHGGEIRVSSLEHRGTSVAVELPRAPDRAGAASRSGSP